ncbi:MAG: amidohydrolase family protein, partial [Solobacterium sp.]|nr:amidohydrolase family protein [Solobacterium sp.]
VRDPVAMKGALGENPKRCYKDKGISARMSTAARMREMMYATLDYMARKEAAGDDPLRKPAYNMKYEAMIPVMKKEIPMKIHAHQANDIITAIRIAKEFDLKLTIEHVTEGHLIADVLERNKQYPLAVGPTLSHASKFELQNKSWTTAGILAERGCHVSIITDSPFSPQEHLPLIAGMAVKGGMDPYEALKAITLNPAEHLGIADRVGSIEEGKDADLLIYKGNPFTLESEIEAVYIDGVRI